MPTKTTSRIFLFFALGITGCSQQELPEKDFFFIETCRLSSSDELAFPFFKNNGKVYLSANLKMGAANDADPCLVFCPTRSLRLFYKDKSGGAFELSGSSIPSHEISITSEAEARSFMDLFFGPKYAPLNWSSCAKNIITKRMNSIKPMGDGFEVNRDAFIFDDSSFCAFNRTWSATLVNRTELLNKSGKITCISTRDLKKVEIGL